MTAKLSAPILISDECPTFRALRIWAVTCGPMVLQFRCKTKTEATKLARRARRALAAAGLLALAGCSVASTDSLPAAPAPPPAISNLGQLDGTTWVKHDNVRSVTCWVYSYEDTMRASTPLSGGISCIPDWLLTKPAGAP